MISVRVTDRRMRALAWRTVPRAMLIARYVYFFRRLPRLRTPETWSEKILHRLLFDRRPQLTLFADKVAVRDYVRERLGGTEHLTQVYAVVSGPSQISGLDLPARYVMKPSHLSHAIRIVHDGAPATRAELEALAASWLRRSLYVEMGEWCYRDIPRRVIFEELLDDGEGSLADYKVHCFDGEPRFLTLIRGRFDGKQTLDMYDMDFRLLPAHLPAPPPSGSPWKEPPPNFKEMIEIARRVSAGVDYVRVDLYNVMGRVIFGELTNYPGAGLLKLIPREWDRKIGSYWRLQ